MKKCRSSIKKAIKAGGSATTTQNFASLYDQNESRGRRCKKHYRKPIRFKDPKLLAELKKAGFLDSFLYHITGKLRR
jgi:hypothetical protein